MNNFLVITCALCYLLVLFGIAYYAEYRHRRGKSIINNSYVYALSMAVYCTAWTYYGSVGRATTHGIEFLTIYLGPTIMAAFMMPVLGKIIRISKFQRINSIADFISTRYGKNFSIAIIVTLLCIVGVIPYISLQLKAISASFNILVCNSHATTAFYNDTTFYISIVLAIFIMLFGTRSVDATEKHEGLVAAIAFESIIKLFAFVCVGFFVTYGMFDGFGDIYERVKQDPEFQKLFVLQENNSYSGWSTMIFLSMMAIVFLPRQFQVSVVENVKEQHLRTAVWLFPLYLLAINVFVLPIAFGGMLSMPASSGGDADMYVLALPMQRGQSFLSLLVFIGGFSAATSMIIVETIAMSTMVSNNIVMPMLLSNPSFKLVIDASFSRSLIYIRRFSIVLILLLAYFYEKYVAHYFSLVSIGIVSFAAVTQFAPAIIGGIYWKGASKNGALTGILVGFLVWFYTLVLPSLANTILGDPDLVSQGLFGWSWLKPQALFGLEGLDNITHSLFWSLFLNIISYIVVSMYSKRKAQEVYQAEVFVDIYKHSSSDNPGMWKGTAYMPDLYSLLENFLGKERATNLIQGYAHRNQIQLDDSHKADPRLVDFSEKVLAGVIGSASARIMVSSVTKEEELSIEEVIKILRESQQMMEVNKELRKKSSELTRTTEDLRNANEQLKQMDALKDEFLYTVTHELRTPLTSIRAMSEILYDNQDMEEEQRLLFLSGVVKETERLSHLITQVLNLEKYESGKQKLSLSSFNFLELTDEAFAALEHLAMAKHIRFHYKRPDSMLLLHADKDLLLQVLINVLGNAVKYTPEHGEILFLVTDHHDEVEVTVQDNGKGIPSEVHQLIFDKFFQARNQTLKKPEGSGLGLAICKRIVEMHSGKIWVESEEGKGARFVFLIPNFTARNINV